MLFEKYVSIIEQNLMAIYGEMIKYYNSPKEVKKEIYNIGIAALKKFGAVDPIEDKIDELLFLYKNGEKEEQEKIKHKLEILNIALKIINETEEMANNGD